MEVGILKIFIMKLAQKVIPFVFLVMVILYLSCQKELFCEDCINNNPPVAKAGKDTLITLPADSASLDGSTSTDSDGSIVRYLWTIISGPGTVIIINDTTPTTKVANLVAGVYQFELKVTDAEGLFSKDTVQIIVIAAGSTNHPPVASAGKDTIITLPVNTVMLDGSASTDPDNNIVSYAWTKISGPSSFNIVNVNAYKHKFLILWKVFTGLN